MSTPAQPMPQQTTAAFDSGAARASVVNRTHRVVREQALAMREQKQRSRSLWVPIAICSPLLLLVCYALYETLAGYAGYELPSVGLVSSALTEVSAQLLLLLVWVLPVTAFLVGILWFRRDHARSQESPR